jgi:hypothetical protein
MASAQTTAQNLDRVFHLTQDRTERDLQEIATTLRSVGDIRQVRADDIAKTVTVAGTAAQIGLAEWLIHALDVAQAPAQPQPFVMPEGSKDLVRIYFTHAARPQDLQEIVTTIRSAADVQRIFTYNSLHAVVLRGGAAELGLADWLMQKLDQPGQNPAPETYPFAGLRGPEVARVFYLVHSRSPRDVQELVTTLRSIADIPRIFVYNASKAVAVRAPADRVALAQWLVRELDQPPDQPPAGTHGYELPAGTDSQVRVFYLNPATTAEQRQRVVSDVHTTLHVGQLYLYNPLTALTVRGTVGQIATAERLLDEANQSGR